MPVGGRFYLGVRLSLYPAYFTSMVTEVMVSPGAVGFLLGSRRVICIDHVHALGDLAKDGVAAVEARLRRKGDEELAAVGVGPALAMATTPGLSKLEVAVLVGELVAGAAPAGAGGVAALGHEALRTRWKVTPS